MVQQPQRSASASQVEWLDELFESIDRRDARGFTTFLTEDASFRFSNEPAVVGRPAIEAAVQEFFAALAGLSHRITLAADLGAHFICRGETTYTRLDGSQVTVPTIYNLPAD